VYQIDNIYADNKFDGARLNDFRKYQDSIYQIIIDPENIPINNSPWYSFRLWSSVDTSINLKIAYTDDFKNRYIPKISHDGTNWKPLDSNYFEVDTTDGSIDLRLSITSEKLWISAQEIISSTDISTWVEELSNVDYINKEVVGKSVLGKSINVLSINEEKSNKSVILIARQHPPEVPGGTIALKAFVQALLSDSEIAVNFRKHFEIIVFPLLNPDGVDMGHWRHNANGIDLNRDWLLFSQPETKAVKDWVLDRMNSNPNQKFCFGIDFHTSYSGPYLLTLDTLPHKITPHITSEWIRQIEDLTKETLDIRPRAQSLPYCYNWIINEVGAEAVTYEEGDEIERQVVKERAELYANSLMSILLDKFKE
jgi:murein tripeptide amidase MpaA